VKATYSRLRRSSSTWSKRPATAEEGAGALVLGAVDDRGGGAVLDDGAAVEHQHAVAHLAGEAHLVGDHQHGEAVVGEGAQHVEHLAHALGVERAGGLVEEQASGSIASARAMATRCCSPPDISWG
jgi:hypothetical protein